MRVAQARSRRREAGREEVVVQVGNEVALRINDVRLHRTDVIAAEWRQPVRGEMAGEDHSRAGALVEFPEGQRTVGEGGSGVAAERRGKHLQGRHLAGGAPGAVGDHQAIFGGVGQSGCRAGVAQHGRRRRAKHTAAGQVDKAGAAVPLPLIAHRGGTINGRAERGRFAQVASDRGRLILDSGRRRSVPQDQGFEVASTNIGEAVGPTGELLENHLVGERRRESGLHKVVIAHVEGRGDVRQVVGVLEVGPAALFTVLAARGVTVIQREHLHRVRAARDETLDGNGLGSAIVAVLVEDIVEVRVAGAVAEGAGAIQGACTLAGLAGDGGHRAIYLEIIGGHGGAVRNVERIFGGAEVLAADDKAGLVGQSGERGGRRGGEDRRVHDRQDGQGHNGAGGPAQRCAHDAVVISGVGQGRVGEAERGVGGAQDVPAIGDGDAVGVPLVAVRPRARGRQAQLVGLADINRRGDRLQDDGRRDLHARGSGVKGGDLVPAQGAVPDGHLVHGAAEVTGAIGIEGVGADVGCPVKELHDVRDGVGGGQLAIGVVEIEGGAGRFNHDRREGPLADRNRQAGVPVIVGGDIVPVVAEVVGDRAVGQAGDRQALPLEDQPDVIGGHFRARVDPRGNGHRVGVKVQRRRGNP